MRKLITAIVGAGLAASLAISATFAQWPTTCLELNDQSEAALDNTQNVGIYQKAFGEAAEDACRNDHKADVQNTFAWAIGGNSGPSLKHVSSGGVDYVDDWTKVNIAKGGVYQLSVYVETRTAPTGAPRQFAVSIPHIQNTYMTLKYDGKGLGSTHAHGGTVWFKHTGGHILLNPIGDWTYFEIELHRLDWLTE